MLNTCVSKFILLRVLDLSDSTCKTLTNLKVLIISIVQSIYLSQITFITSQHLNICKSEVALNYAKNVSRVSESFGPKYHISKASSLKNRTNDLITQISIEAPYSIYLFIFSFLLVCVFHNGDFCS